MLLRVLSKQNFTVGIRVFEDGLQKEMVMMEPKGDVCIQVEDSVKLIKVEFIEVNTIVDKIFFYIGRMFFLLLSSYTKTEKFSDFNFANYVSVIIEKEELDGAIEVIYKKHYVKNKRININVGIVKANIPKKYVFEKELFVEKMRSDFRMIYITAFTCCSPIWIILFYYCGIKQWSIVGLTVIILMVIGISCYFTCENEKERWKEIACHYEEYVSILNADRVI